jgi:hypothetical protein
LEVGYRSALVANGGEHEHGVGHRGSGRQQARVGVDEGASLESEGGELGKYRQHLFVSVGEVGTTVAHQFDGAGLIAFV